MPKVNCYHIICRDEIQISTYNRGKAVGPVANKRCTVERSICLFFSCETETIKRRTKLEIRIVQEGKKFLHFLGFFSSSFAGSVFYKKHSRKTKPNHSSFLFTQEL